MLCKEMRKLVRATLPGVAIAGMMERIEAHSETRMRRLALFALLLALVPSGARAACCQLAKVEAEPAMTHVRVCEPATSSGCATWIFEGDVTFGTPHEVCAAGEAITYQELDPAQGSYGPPTEARCEEGRDVEL